MFWIFGKKREIEKIKQDVQKSFESVKQDFSKVSQWIEHIDGKHQTHDDSLSTIKEQLLEMQNDLEGLKNTLSFFSPAVSKQLSKQPQTAVQKQTAVQAVQTPVQTAVQTPVQTAVQTTIFDSLTMMERAIIWALINSGMKLSYEDLGALLGKDKSTVRGQINSIKQKSANLIKESREVSGKKRLYIPEEMKENIVKSVKVKVKKSKKSEKTKEKQENKE